MYRIEAAKPYSDDYDATVAQLRSRGVAFREKPDNATPWAQIFLTDPDGNGIELNAARRGE